MLLAISLHLFDLLAISEFQHHFFSVDLQSWYFFIIPIFRVGTECFLSYDNDWHIITFMHQVNHIKSWTRFWMFWCFCRLFALTYCFRGFTIIPLFLSLIFSLTVIMHHCNKLSLEGQEVQQCWIIVIGSCTHS